MNGDFIFLYFFYARYFIYHCFIYRPSDTTVKEDRTQDCCDLGIDRQTL
jgi:hypothetical protein